MHRILILSSAAIALSGCSFLNGSSHSNSGAYPQQHSSSYGHNCGTVNCAPENSYSVANEVSDYGDHSHYGHNAPQQPSANAYGSQVQGHPAYGAQSQSYGHPNQGYGQAPQLRGAYGPRGRQAYKYGTLGGIAYDVDSDLYGLQGRLGYQSANYWGAEVEGSFGVIGDDETIGTSELETDIDYSLAAFARGVVPLGQRFNIFGRVGYHVTEVSGELTDATGTTLEGSDTTDGIAYGAGAEYAFTPRDSIRLDYTRYDLGPGDTDSVAVSYARKF